MDILEDRYVILGRKVSSILGFWPLQTYKERFLRSCIVSFSLLYGVLAQLCQLFTLDFNLRSIVWVLQMFIPCLCTASVYYTFILHFVTVRSIFIFILKECKQLRDDVELKITQKHFNESKLFTTISGCTKKILQSCRVILLYETFNLIIPFIQFISLCFTISAMFSIFISSSILPFILRITISTNEITYGRDRYPELSCFNYFFEQERYYYPIIIYQILTIIIMGAVSTIFYSMYFWLIQFTCTCLCIIKVKIQEFFQNDQRKCKETSLDLSDYTIDIIQRLAKTRRLMVKVNEMGEKAYLFQMLMAFVLIVIDVLCMFEVPLLMQHKETRKDAYAFLFFIVDTIIVIYVNCYIGQRLVDCSNDVYHELCLIPIHDISVKTQKLLLMTLMMNTKPCAISIGKMFVSSHKFFSDLFQTALSFAMVLRSIQ